MGLALGWASGPAVAAPKAELQPYWDRSDAANPAAIDHSPWQGLLDAYLDTRHPSGVHRFAYAAVRSADRAVLRAYLAALQALDPRRYSRPEQEAYWINLYNALTVDLVLAHYPVKSIREIGGGWLLRGPWDDAIAKVAGRALSLNDIEHGVLRPIWRDPRIHYAVNCASIGCPNLCGAGLHAGEPGEAARRGRPRLRKSPARRRVAGWQASRLQYLRLVSGRLRRDGGRGSGPSPALRPVGAGPAPAGLCGADRL